jgi:hypothetical protein
MRTSAKPPSAIARTSEKPNFSGAQTLFGRIQFSGAQTDCSGAQFSAAETIFYEARFSSELSSFARASFKERVSFIGRADNAVFGARSWVQFEHCRIDKPELLTFNTVLLRPGWFINVDVRKVDFTDVKWYGVTDGPRVKVKEEIKALEKHGVGSPYTRLAQACQRLATNAEENRNHLHASSFNYWAMDAQRKGQWASAFALWRLIWWYWALSGYGERTWRSAAWLVGILVGVALLYLLVGYVEVDERSLSGIWQAFSQAIVYSLGVMSRQAERLSGSESTLLRSLVLIEGIFGPLQVALLALALRRRFMRGKG